MQFGSDSWQLLATSEEGLLLHQLGLLRPLPRPELTVDFIRALVQLSRSWQHRPLAEH